MSIQLTAPQSHALSTAAQQAAAKALATSSQGSSTSGPQSSSTDTSGTALASLSSNFNDFLSLLTAQLKNQDPSSPMDSSQFTTELVQFTGVQQQVQTNSNLTQLLSLTQDQQLSQSSSMIGKQVVLTGSTVPLQAGGSNKVSFTTPLAEPVAISLLDPSGRDVRDIQMTSVAGQNSWTWDGKDNDGNLLAPGAYTVAVEGADATGSNAPIAFTTSGIPTSVQRSPTGLTVSFGQTTLDYSSVQSVSQ